ncbi:TPA: hypothetical protein ACY4R5_001718 [Clostridium perfringens]|uniref:hypothetical protein n=1 Tax=Clostridium perfringens TaxID=1502 RepID=UPI003B00DAAC
MDYINRKITQNVFDNIILIRWFINAYFDGTEELGSLLPNKYIKPEDITIIEVSK